MKGLTTRQNHAYTSIVHWIKDCAENAPPLALQKIVRAPATRDLFLEAAKHDVPGTEKFVDVLQKGIAKEKRKQKQSKTSKRTEAVLLPVRGGITKKPRFNHVAKADHFAEELQLQSTMFATTADIGGGDFYRSNDEAEEEAIYLAQPQKESGNEIADCTENEQTSGMVTLKQKETGAKGKKAGEQTGIDSDDKSAMVADEISSARKKYTAYCTELDIIRGTTAGLEEMKLYFRGLQDCSRPLAAAKFEAEVEGVFYAGTKLCPDISKSKVLELAERTLGSPELRTQIPATAWDKEDPIGIYNAIEQASAHSDQAKIHRAYGQMQLFTSVNLLVKRGRRSAQKHKMDADPHKLPQLDFLDGLADEKVGDAKLELKWQMRAKFRSEYYGGNNWLDMAALFEGTGVVFVFVMARELLLPLLLGPTYKGLSSNVLF